MKTLQEIKEEVSIKHYGMPYIDLLRYGSIAHSDVILNDVAKIYADQAIQEGADRIYEDVSERIFETVLSVKEDLA